MEEKKQTWGENNLDVRHFRNGDSIFEARDNQDWINAGNEGKPAWCYPSNDCKFGDRFGKLYNWYAVHDPRGLAPKGWYIPSEDEWRLFIFNNGGMDNAYDKIKLSKGWEDIGIDHHRKNSDFPCRWESGQFDSLGGFSWWTSTENKNISCDKYFVRQIAGYARGCYVRCLKGDGPSTNVITIRGQEWMFDNLNVTNFRNGDPIPELKSYKEWSNAARSCLPACCNVGDIFRKELLYNWYAVNDPRGLAPEGWRIPNLSELSAFVSYGLEQNVNLRFTGHRKSGIFTDSNCGYYGRAANFWSSDEYYKTQAHHIYVLQEPKQFLIESWVKGDGMSIRCIKIKSPNLNTTTLNTSSPLSILRRLFKR